MKKIHLHEGELNIMELLWSNKVLAAKDISKIIKEYIGWEKNTTYTVIKRLVDKGAILREDPGFFCKAAISRKAVQSIETQSLLMHYYSGSLNHFINEFLAVQSLTSEELHSLEKILLAQKF